MTESTEYCGTTYQNPAFGVFEEGMQITSINGKESNNVGVIQGEIAANRFKPMTFGLRDSNADFNVTLAPNDLGAFGFAIENIENPDFIVPEQYNTYSFAVNFLIEFIYWFIILNFLIAFVNFIPFFIFDGGRIAPFIYAPYLASFMSEEEARKFVSRATMIIILALFFINVLPLIL